MKISWAEGACGWVFARAALRAARAGEIDEMGKRAGGGRGVGADRPGVCTRVSARLFAHPTYSRCARISGGPGPVLSLHGCKLQPRPVRSECAGTLCCTPGFRNGLQAPARCRRGQVSLWAHPPSGRRQAFVLLPAIEGASPTLCSLPRQRGFHLAGQRAPGGREEVETYEAKEHTWGPEGAYTCEARGLHPGSPHNRVKRDCVGWVTRGPRERACTYEAEDHTGVPAFVFHPAPSGWNLLWKREDFTRGPRTIE